jgi:2-methylcitrate dehydratase PrpD
MQFSVEPSGGEVKRVHAGFAARGGVMAAEFALMPSVTAPQRALEGRYGLAAIFGGPLRAVTPSERLEIHDISLKPYACCRLFHSTIDALAEVTQGFRVPATAIAEIVVSGPQLIADQHMLARPQSTMAAQYSCPYIVGATLAHGPQRYDAYDDAFLHEPAILDIAAKVRFELSEELTAHYPRSFATGVRIRFHDGSTKSCVVIDSVGTPQKPLTREQILAKAAGLVSHPKSGAPGPRLAELIWDDRCDARALAEALAKS